MDGNTEMTEQDSATELMETRREMQAMASRVDEMVMETEGRRAENETVLASLDADQINEVQTHIP